MRSADMLIGIGRSVENVNSFRGSIKEWYGDATAERLFEILEMECIDRRSNKHCRIRAEETRDFHCLLVFYNPIG